MGVVTGAEVIREMSRNTFYYQVMKGIARTHEFSALVVGGPMVLSDSEKDFLRSGLDAIGISYEMTETDYDLTEVAVAIASRSVSLH